MKAPAVVTAAQVNALRAKLEDSAAYVEACRAVTFGAYPRAAQAIRTALFYLDQLDPLILQGRGGEALALGLYQATIDNAQAAGIKVS
jgi:hypothetical protein